MVRMPAFPLFAIKTDNIRVKAGHDRPDQMFPTSGAVSVRVHFFRPSAPVKDNPGVLG
jgi:hypothetical protein